MYNSTLFFPTLWFYILFEIIVLFEQSLMTAFITKIIIKSKNTKHYVFNKY